MDRGGGALYSACVFCALLFCVRKWRSPCFYCFFRILHYRTSLLLRCQRICIDLLDDPLDAHPDRRIRGDFHDAAPIGKRRLLQHGQILQWCILREGASSSAPPRPNTTPAARPAASPPVSRPFHTSFLRSYPWPPSRSLLCEPILSLVPAIDVHEVFLNVSLAIRQV